MKKIVKREVRAFLKRAKKYRNDDRVLTLAVWKEHGFYLTPRQEQIFLRLPSAETISRRRREMRTEFPESEAVAERRYRRFQKFQDKYSKHSRWFRRRMA